MVVSSLKGGKKEGNRLINREDPEQDNLEEDVACDEHEEEDNDEDVEEEEDS